MAQITLEVKVGEGGSQIGMAEVLGKLGALGVTPVSSITFKIDVIEARVPVTEEKIQKVFEDRPFGIEVAYQVKGDKKDVLRRRLSAAGGATPMDRLIAQSAEAEASAPTVATEEEEEPAEEAPAGMDPDEMIRRALDQAGGLAEEAPNQDDDEADEADEEPEKGKE